MNAHRSVCSVCIGIGILMASIPAAAQQEPKSLQSFGVQVKHGQPVYPLPPNVALGLFNPDPLLDLAYYAEGKVQVWQNLGNGTFGYAPVFEQRVNGEVQKLELKKSRMFTETIFDKDSWADLVLTFANGSTETISHQWMNSAAKSFTSLPQSSSGFPSLNFREVWRSEPNLGLGTGVLLGDIDNDGKTELVYMFYPGIGDNIRRLVVYENVGPGSYTVDWDTSVTTLNGVFDITDIDNDGHKEIVTAYFPYGINILPTVALLECFGPRQYRFYNTNIGFQRPIFEVKGSDINHNSVRELSVLTSDPSATQDPTFVYVSEFVSKGPSPSSPSGWMLSFNQQLARFYGYSFRMAIGQLDGLGWDEIIPAGGSFGFHEPVPVQYLWYSGLPSPYNWIPREIYTGLESGTGAVMFANLDADTVLEFVSGAPGPIGHGSMFALDYQHDTTWSVMWADSSLRSAPLWVNSGYLNGQFVLAGANVWTHGPDTTYGELYAYRPDGYEVGFWHQDSVSIQQFHLLDIDTNSRTNLIFARISPWIDNCLIDVESDTTIAGVDPRETLPEQLELMQNFPNPFNPSTKIVFSVPRHEQAALRVYNILGQLVTVLFENEIEKGRHSVTWDATNQPSGVYFYRLEIGARTITKKMLLVR